MMEAAFLLESSDEPIARIASRVGYETAAAFSKLSIAITAYRRAVTEPLDALTAAEAEDDRELSATLGAFEACVVGRPAAQLLLPSQRQDLGRRQL